MNNKEISIGSILLVVIFSALVIYMTFIFSPTKRDINNYYQVYLGGEKIGLIASKEELYDLINDEEKEIKEKYNVDKVYSPHGLEIHEVSTYNNNLMTAKEVYERIKDIDPFTIEVMK